MSAPKIVLVFPHQLFEQHPALEETDAQWVLLEDPLFFFDRHCGVRMHKQKLWLHRASMKRYAAWLEERGCSVTYLDFEPNQKSIAARLSSALPGLGEETRLLVADPVDFLVEKRLKRCCSQLGWTVTLLESPGFINSRAQNQEFAKGRKSWRMVDFYRAQRRRLGILMDGEEPVGGKWSFDEENRKKVPKKLLGSIPRRLELKRDEFDREAREYVQTQFQAYPGELNELYYPTSHQDARAWLKVFLEERFEKFGPYEDAIVESQSWLWHSVLTPALNIGLLTPQEIIASTLAFAEEREVPLNSLEGFVRQVIGWREFMRAAYDDLGVEMRTANHWGHRNKMPSAFYDGTTGLEPVDDVILRTKATGYCHHIERLMVLGGLFFLCEIDPKEVYKWFMEMFVDSYDWVMVPNVFSMSQNADGGLTTTKPYFSGSAYVRKMSHYKKGPWCEAWDGLYWSWVDRNREQLARNPRWAMMCASAAKMDPEKMSAHRSNAEIFRKRMRLRT